MADVSTLEAARDWLGEKYKEYIKDPATRADLNDDGTPDLEQFKKWLASRGDNVSTTASTAFDTIKQAGADAGQLLNGWAMSARQAAEEATKEGGFLDNNKFSLMALIGGGLLAAMLGMGPMGMLVMALLGAVLGGMGDGKDSLIGGLFGGGEKPAHTPTGDTQQREGETPQAGVVQTLQLTADGKVATNEQETHMIVQGRYEGEGANRTFLVERAAIRGEDGQFKRNEDGSYVLDGVGSNAGLRLTTDGISVVSSEANKNLVGNISAAIVATRLQAAEATNAAPEQPAAAPQQPAATPEQSAASPQQPATASAEQQQPAANPESPAASGAAATAVAAAISTAAIAATPEPVTRIPVLDEDGRSIRRIYLDNEGTPVTDRENATVILQGNYERGGNLFRVEQYAARKPDGSFMDMKNVYEGGLLSQLTLNVTDNAIDLTDETNRSRLQKGIDLATGYRDAVALSEEVRAREERFTKLSRSAEMEIVDSQPVRDPDGKPGNLVTVNYTSLDSKGREYTAVLTGIMSNYTESRRVEGDADFLGNRPSRTETTTYARLTVRSGSLLGEDGNPISDNFIGAQPLVINRIPARGRHTVFSGAGRSQVLDSTVANLVDQIAARNSTVTEELVPGEQGGPNLVAAANTTERNVTR